MRGNIHTRISPLYPALLAAAVVLSFLLKAAIFQDYIIGSEGVDFRPQWFPFHLFCRSEYRDGFFPLWSHNLFAGYPLGSFPHAAVFYPLNIFFYLGDYQWGSTLFFLFHLCLGGLFVYLLSRQFQVSATSAGFAAICFALSGPVFWNLGNQQEFLTGIWLPGFYWAGYRLLRRPVLGSLLLVAAVFSMMVLSGNFELVVAALLTFAVLAVIDWRQWRNFPALGGALAVGGGIALVQVLLTAASLPQSYRHFHGTEFLSCPSFVVLQEFINMLLQRPPLPDRPVTPGFFSFLPLLGLMLLPSVMGDRRRRFVVIVLILAYLPGILDLPEYMALVRRIPFWGRFSSADVQYRLFASTISLTFAVSAGGLDILERGLARGNLRRVQVFMIFYLGCQLFFLVPSLEATHLSALHLSRLGLIALLIYLFFRGLRTGENKSFTHPIFLLAIIFFDLAVPSLVGPMHEDRKVYEQKAFNQIFLQQKVTERIHFVSPYRGDGDAWRMFRLNRGPGYLVGTIRNGLVDYFDLIRQMRDRDLELFMPGFVSARSQPLLDYLGVKYLGAREVLPALSQPYPLDNKYLPSFYVDREVSLSRPPQEGGLLALRPGGRWEVKAEVLPGDRLVLPAAGPAPLVKVAGGLGREVVRTLKAVPDPAGWAFKIPVRRPESWLFVIQSAGGPVAIPAPYLAGPARPYQLTYSRNTLGVYSNQGAMARFTLFSRARVLPRERTLQALFDRRQFDPRQELLLSDAAAAPREGDSGRPDARAAAAASPGGLGPGRAEVKLYQQGRMMVETESTAESWLSNAEVYYPGWRVMVDGREARLVRANYAFQAVRIPAGRHRVEYRFVPREFAIGLWFCLSTLGFTATLGAVRAFRRGRAFLARLSLVPNFIP